MSDLGFFLLALWGKWQALLTGGVLAVLVMLTERIRKKTLSWPTFGTIMAIALLWSCFFAWRDEHTAVAKLTIQERTETERLNGDIGGLKADLKTAQASGVEKDKRIADLQLLLDQKPPIQRLPIITVQPAPVVATERSWLVVESVAADLSSTPFNVVVTVRNTGQIPALGLKAAGGVTIDKSIKPDLSRPRAFRKLLGNGLDYSFTVAMNGWDANRLQEIRSGTLTLFFYFRVEYYDTNAAARDPLESCSYWSPDTKTFNECIEP